MRTAITIALLVAAACSSGGTSTPTPPPPPGPPPPPPVGQGTVQVQNDFFNPEVVSITVGGTVTWNWVGQDHNVTSVLSPSFSPNSPTRNAPFTHEHTFNTAGTFRYICTVHGAVSGSQTSGMRGSVVVVP